MRESDNHVGVASVLRRNASAMLIAAGATMTVQLGTYFAASGAMSSPGATVVTLLVSLLWIVVTAPVFAAGGRSTLDGLLRGGVVVDAGAVVLVVLAAGGALVGTAGAIKIYLIWCSLALAGCSLVLLGRNAANRHVMAVFAVLLMLAVAAGPFWTNGIIMSASSPWRERVGFIVRAANPVFAITECLAGTPRFVWNERSILYEHTVLGRDVPVRAAAWYVTAGAYSIFAFAAGSIAAVLRRRRRRRSLPRE